MASTRHPRSRTGCWICRLRKKKCDETRPTCQQCQNLKIQCDGYGAAKPAWMEDPAEGKRKKDEIKLQIGKRGRRGRRTRPVKVLKSGETVQRQHGGCDDGENTTTITTTTLEGDTATRVSDKLDDNEGRTDETQLFVFEAVKGEIQNLKPLNENPEKSSSQAVAMLDSLHPLTGCFRCPIKNPSSGSARPVSDYGLQDTYAYKPLLQDTKPGVILVTPQPWKQTETTVSIARTKEEEIDNDEYDAILALFTSTSKSQTTFGSPATPLKPPIDLHLIRNYIQNVFRLSYGGMSGARIHKSLREVVVPLLCTNLGFAKGCMSKSAMHLAISGGESGPHFQDLLIESLENGIKCIQYLSKRLSDEGTSEKTLALMLTLTTLEASSPLPNWKPHLKAAVDCLVEMDLLNRPNRSAIAKFLMSRVIWLDILSALTLGRAPQLWANYREILSRPVQERSFCGLLEMMGCDDTVMFLLSEVMCVEDYKLRTLGGGMISWARARERAIELDIYLRDRDLPVAVKLPPSAEPPFTPLPSDGDSGLGDANSYFVSPSPSSTMSDPVIKKDNPFPTFPSRALKVAPLSPPITSEGTNSREQTIFGDADCSNNHPIPPELLSDQGMIAQITTAAFRTAARIHLWSIELGFYPRSSFFKQLLEELMVMVALVPIGLSRIVAWPLLVGGCIATEPRDREYFVGRCTIGNGGTLCEIAKVMREVWRRSDESDRVGCGKEVHWRSVMRDQGMEILLV